MRLDLLEEVLPGTHAGNHFEMLAALVECSTQ
jgi:hypothetical protein